MEERSPEDPWDALKRLLRRDFALVADQDPFPTPHFAVCHTPLPADFCTCGRYALFEAESEAPWD